MIRELIREMLLVEEATQPEFHRVEFKIRDVSKLFSLFHITPNYLGDTFISRLKPPQRPYEDENGDVVEDDSTDRMSVASSIEKCVIGFSDGEGFGLQVYAVEDNAKSFVPFGEWCPSSEDNEYGPEFMWKPWAVENNMDPGDDDERSQVFDNCVPDAIDTGEKWITQPTKMRYLGEITGTKTMKLSKFITKTELINRFKSQK